VHRSGAPELERRGREGREKERGGGWAGGATESRLYRTVNTGRQESTRPLTRTGNGHHLCRLPETCSICKHARESHRDAKSRFRLSLHSAQIPCRRGWAHIDSWSTRRGGGGPVEAGRRGNGSREPVCTCVVTWRRSLQDRGMCRCGMFRFPRTDPEDQSNGRRGIGNLKLGWTGLGWAGRGWAGGLTVAQTRVGRNVRSRTVR